MVFGSAEIEEANFLRIELGWIDFIIIPRNFSIFPHSVHSFWFHFMNFDKWDEKKMQNKY